jgi:DNA-binding NarL/FixJ family response regulator
MVALRQMGTVDQSELTDVEQQVARLVAWGGSNRDVAEALGIEAKAVEQHLARIYRRFGIRSGEGSSPDAFGEASRRAALEYERIVERREQ